MEKCDTVIIGGGIAGLTASYKIKSGKFVLLEKEDKLGGKLKTVREQKFIADVGAQFFLDGFHSTFKLIKELKMQNHLNKLNSPQIAFYSDNKIHPVKNSFLSLLKTSFISFKTKLNLVRMIRKINDIEKNTSFNFYNRFLGTEHDNISISDWIIENFEEDLLEYFVQPILTSLTLSHPEKLSATYGLTLLNYLFRNVFIFENGMDFLATSLEQKISKRIKINTMADVKKIEIKNDTIYDVIFVKDGKKQYIKSKNVISAVPLPILLNLIDMSKDYKKKLKEIEYASAISISLGTKRRIFDKSFSILFSRKESKFITAVIESTFKDLIFAPKNKGLLNVFINGENANSMLNRSDEWIKNKTINELNKFFPNLKEDEEWFHIDRWKYGIPVHKPGYSKFLPYFNIPIKGLILCGDYLYLPSIEAAVYSGLEAADKLNKIKNVI